MPQARTIAAIDIGTSSVHLAIARPIDGARPEIIARERLPVRLGSGGKDMKTLNDDAVDRTIEALSHFSSLAEAHNADLYAVATSATREAEDPSEFLRRARDEAGIDIHVIAGVEEARLIHLGVLGAMPIADTRHLVIDIGGGSTELIVGDGRTSETLRSLKVGHVRLTDRFFSDGRETASSVAECTDFIRSFLARDAVLIRDAAVEVVVGCSGTFETIANLVLRRLDADDRRAQIRREDVIAVVSDIVEARTADPPKPIRGVDEHRQDTILAGALLVDALMSELGFSSFEVSPDALREGLLLDRLNRRSPNGDALHHLDGIRANSVDRVAARYGENVVHARQATDIALRIYDATTDLHGCTAEDRDILEAGAMLHNIGRFVGHGGHHKHSYYLIRNTEHLAGFDEHERERIAHVARYHRKSAPKRSHNDFSRLTPDDQRTISILSGMLRIGIALDRTYRNVAGDVTVVATTERVDIQVAGEDLDVELFAANQRKGLLADALGVEVVVRERT